MIQRFFSAACWIFVFTAAGCATASSARNQSPKSSATDARSAIGTIADAIKGEAVTAKYCPVCGRHYSSSLRTCPKDGSALKEVED